MASCPRSWTSRVRKASARRTRVKITGIIGVNEIVKIGRKTITFCLKKTKPTFGCSTKPRAQCFNYNWWGPHSPKRKRAKWENGRAIVASSLDCLTNAVKSLCGARSKVITLGLSYCRIRGRVVVATTHNWSKINAGNTRQTYLVWQWGFRFWWNYCMGGYGSWATA